MVERSLLTWGNWYNYLPGSRMRKRLWLSERSGEETNLVNEQGVEGRGLRQIA
jgi:hypothetical protein